MLASEMKKLAESYNKYSDGISPELMTIIKNAANSGNTQVCIREYLVCNDAEALVDAGYRFDYEDDFYCTIYWD